MTIREFNLCVDKYADGVYRFIVKNIGDHEIAKDVVQESFSRMWEKVSGISFEKSKSYLYTTAYHTMIDMIRKMKRFTPLQPGHHINISEENDFSDLKEILDEAVNFLPEKQKSVIMLRDYEGYSYKEIGEIVGLNESQVKVYIFRARKFLKNYLVRMDAVI